ncbi:unnamed protein product [Brassica napus]|uniref:(rape) hypothetical protein n=1 Tax=Brassica napus TaxID=3708 RepID=A0A816RPR0_BRANA|nr:unnamed protein product [Brassica napus]
MLARSHDEIKYGAISVVLDIKNITAVTMAAIDESQDMQKSASKFPDEQWDPMFTVRIAQKNHHPQRFQTKGPDNVPPDGIRFLKSCAFNTPLYEQVRIFESFTCLICFCFGVSFIVLTEPFIHYDWVSYLIGFREFVVLVYWSTRNDVLLSALYLCSYFELKLTFVGV